jgi:hypothetical protein
MLKWLRTVLQRHTVQEVPNELAACEFGWQNSGILAQQLGSNARAEFCIQNS